MAHFIARELALEKLRSSTRYIIVACFRVCGTQHNCVKPSLECALLIDRLRYSKFLLQCLHKLSNGLMSSAELPIHKLARCFVISLSFRKGFSASLSFRMLVSKGSSKLHKRSLGGTADSCTCSTPQRSLCNSAGTAVFLLWYSL